MRRVIVSALLLAACGHAKEAEVVASLEARATIGQTLTADTTRLQPTDGSATSEAGAKALAEAIESQLAAVGRLRPAQMTADHIDLVADLPAPNWALHVRISPRPELLCLVLIEPITTLPQEHAVEAAPWSVQDAFDQLRRAVPTLQPSRLPPMEPARFARLRAEATAAAAEGRDPALSPSEYVRMPRPITSEGVDRPYVVPPRSGQQQ
jgi:hypothetical protein